MFGQSRTMDAMRKGRRRHSRYHRRPRPAGALDFRHRGTAKTRQLDRLPRPTYAPVGNCAV